MTGVERILDRAIHLARWGQHNPSLAILDSVDMGGDEVADTVQAWAAAAGAAGCSLTRWYEGAPKRRKLQETVALLEEALFQVQVSG